MQLACRQSRVELWADPLPVNWHMTAGSNFHTSNMAAQAGPKARPDLDSRPHFTLRHDPKAGCADILNRVTAQGDRQHMFADSAWRAWQAGRGSMLVAAGCSHSQSTCSAPTPFASKLSGYTSLTSA